MLQSTNLISKFFFKAFYFVMLFPIRKTMSDQLTKKKMLQNSRAFFHFFWLKQTLLCNNWQTIVLQDEDF